MNLMELTWQPGAVCEGKQVALGIDKDGKWYACSEKPYFCFEGPDRLYVIDLACRALAFYRDAKPTEVTS